jgi:hypothetical protein
MSYFITFEFLFWRWYCERMSSPLTLEERVAALESSVHRILSDANREPHQKDWRRTIGMFAGDELMKEIDREGAKIREEDKLRNGE